VPAPRITPLGPQARIAWPNWAGWRLESATNLLPPAVWATLTNTPTLAGDQALLTNSIGNENRFYRLAKP